MGQFVNDRDQALASGRVGSAQRGRAVEIAGEVNRYRSSDWADRGFCPRCGTNLFYHHLPADTYAFTAGLFPDDAFLPLREEIFIDEKARNTKPLNAPDNL